MASFATLSQFIPSSIPCVPPWCGWGLVSSLEDRWDATVAQAVGYPRLPLGDGDPQYFLFTGKVRGAAPPLHWEGKPVRSTPPLIVVHRNSILQKVTIKSRRRARVGWDVCRRMLTQLPFKQCQHYSSGWMASLLPTGRKFSRRPSPVRLLGVEGD